MQWGLWFIQYTKYQVQGDATLGALFKRPPLMSMRITAEFQGGGTELKTDSAAAAAQT